MKHQKIGMLLLLLHFKICLCINFFFLLKFNRDLFYKRNTTKFFKNRYWIGREFKELSFEQDSELNDRRKVVLELGCGVGNFIFPVLETNPLLFIYACDFSKRAIEFVKVFTCICYLRT